MNVDYHTFRCVLKVINAKRNWGGKRKKYKRLKSSLFLTFKSRGPHDIKLRTEIIYICTIFPHTAELKKAWKFHIVSALSFLLCIKKTCIGSSLGSRGVTIQRRKLYEAIRYLQLTRQKWSNNLNPFFQIRWTSPMMRLICHAQPARPEAMPSTALTDAVH